jgi:hypothetical protein
MREENMNIESDPRNQHTSSNENFEYSTFVGWVKKHKKGILIAEGAIVAIGAGCVVYKNWDSITSIFKAVKPGPVAINTPPASVMASMPVVDVIPEISTEAVSKIINNGEPFGVCGHPRNLSNGRNASAGKIALALEHGIELREHQTWVENYLKNCA